MKPSNHEFIDNLVKKNKTTHSISFKQPLAKFVAFSVLYSYFIGYIFYNLRADIETKAANPYFILEILSTSFLGALALLYTFITLKPSQQKTKLTNNFFILLIIFIFALATIASQTQHLNTSHFLDELHCVGSMSIIAIPNIFIGLHFFKSQMTTHPKLLGFSLFTYCAAIGYMLVRLTCATEALDHQTILHFLPFTLYGLAGIYIGNKHLRW